MPLAKLTFFTMKNFNLRRRNLKYALSTTERFKIFAPSVLPFYLIRFVVLHF